MTGRTGFFISFCLVVSVVDARTFKIPDILLLICVPVLIFCDRHGSPVFFYTRIAAAIVSYMVFYFMYAYTGGLGFGDVKYAALLGYALGIEKTGIAFLLTASGVILMYVIGIGFFRWEKSAKLPFAPFLSFGAIAAELINSHIMAG
jgi:prepilin signal peptidase PulO-like enzyme (type II secretory pathway)